MAPFLWLLTPVLFSVVTPPAPTQAISLGTRNLTCPTSCECEATCFTDYLQTFFTENTDKLGRGSRPETDENISKFLNVLKSNILLKLLLGSKLVTRLTCTVGGNNVSLDALIASTPGVFIEGVFKCEESAVLQFDTYPASKLLTTLSISGCQIVSSSSPFKFPIFNLLMTLELQSVNVDFLNSLDLSNLNNLRVLKVTGNNMTQLPVLWTNVSLNQVFLLDLSGNKLQQYNCELGWGLSLFSMQSIDTINIEDNSLSEIPRCLLERKEHIPYISLARNYIRDTSAFRSTGSYIAAYSLNVQGNQIETVRYFTISDMSALDLSRNRIESIDVTSFRCVDYNNLLKRLDLSFNRISHIEYGSLDFTPLLTYLDLSHNNIVSFDIEFTPVYNANITIDLRFNQMSYPPFHNSGYLGPRTVKFLTANNTFFCDCSMLQFVSIYQELRQYSNGSATSEFRAIQTFSDADEYFCTAPYFLHETRVIELPIGQRSCPIVRNCPRKCRCDMWSNVTTVSCQLQSLTSLPKILPGTEALTVDFSKNNISKVEYRNYFLLTTELDLSFNRITSVHLSALVSVLNISVVDLKSNNLTRLPPEIEALDLSVEQLSLHDNPWECSCDTLWMGAWIRRLGKRVLLSEEIRCYGGVFDGQPMVEVRRDELKCETESHVTLAIVMGVVLALVVLLVVLFYWKRLEVKILLYYRFNWGILKRDAFPKDLTYDAFISFSQHDYQWIVHTLAPALESQDPPYKLCLHYRDFPVGQPIAESIVDAIENSRSTVMLVSNAFLRSEWCLYEFQTAHQRLFDNNSSRLIIILQDGVDIKDMDKTLSAYINTNTFVKEKDKNFWKKLYFIMPKPNDN